MNDIEKERERRHGRVREDREKRIEELFGNFPGAVDWAEDLAREVTVDAIDIQRMSGNIAEEFFHLPRERNKKPEQHLAWGIAIALAPALRGLRHDARQSMEDKVGGKVKYATKKLREQFADPSFLAEFLRDAAGNLDGRGLSTEGNVLRDAANILGEEF